MNQTPIIPVWLKPGDLVGITATARSIGQEELNHFSRFLQERGLKVQLASSIGKVQNQFAGTDEERAESFNELLRNPQIRAIFCARGGYGSARLLHLLDQEALRKDPKWIVGFSDITALHSWLWQSLRMASIHAVMPSVITGSDPESENQSLQSLWEALSGKTLEYPLPTHPFNRGNKAEGVLLGGNLSVLYSLRGTPFDLNTEGCILMLEDLDEYVYHVDRMMLNLSLGEKIQHLSGLICGGMTGMNDNQVPFGKTAEEIIYEHVLSYPFPFRFGAPFGHISPNLALRFGMTARIEGNQLILPSHL